MYYFFIILVAVIFYLLIPALGLFFASRNQQRFIDRTAQSRFFPLYPDHFIHDDTFVTPPDNTSIRFFGKITSWEKSNLMILENQGLQVKVQLKQGRITTLVPGPDKKSLATYRLKTLDLQNIGAVNIHTNVFVCGLIQKTEMPNKQEMMTFIESEQNPLTVVLFEGDHGQFFARLLMAAAHFPTDSIVLFPSLMTGFFCLLLMFTAMVQTGLPQSYALTAAVSLLSIFTLILPPGAVCWIPARTFVKRSAESRRFSVFLNALLYGLAPSSESNVDSATEQVPINEQQNTDVDEPAPETATGDSELLDTNTYTAAMPSGSVFASSRNVPDSADPAQLPPEIEQEGRSQWTAFGELNNGALQSAADPFFPFAVIPGDPRRLLNQIAQKTRRWHLLTAGFVTAGVSANIYILAKLLRWLT